MELFLVKEGNEDYIKQIIELEAEIFGKNGAIDYWNLKPMIKYGRVYVLLKDEKVVACAELTKDWEEKKVYLYGFAVKAEEKGKGLGNELLSKLLEECKKEEIKSIELTVALDNLIAIKLYEKFGFQKVKYLENEYGKGIHRLLYKKIL